METNKSKHILLGFIVISLTLLTGCQEPQVNSGNVPPVRSDIRKTEIRQKLEKNYANADLHYELGKIYQSEGQWGKAIRRAIGYDPVNWEAAAASVKTLYQAGKDDRATIMTENYIDEAGYSATSSLQLGKAFQDEQLEDEALSCYQQALRIAPNSAGLNKQIGFYYLAKNDQARAEQYFRRSFQIKPDPEVAGALGRMGIAIGLPKPTTGTANDVDKMLENESK